MAGIHWSSQIKTNLKPTFYSNAFAESLVKADHKVKHFPGEALD